MTPKAHWWLTTIGGVVGAAVAAYAATDGPGHEVAATAAGLIALILGYFNGSRT